jgi:hypothetical protein
LTTEFLQSSQKDVHIPYVTEPALIRVHPAEVVRRILRQERFNDFRRIAKLLEGDSRLVNTHRIRLLEAGGGVGRFGEQNIHDRECRGSTAARSLLQRPADLAEPFAHDGWPGTLKLPVRLAQEAFLSSLKVLLKLCRLSDGLRPLRQLQQHHLHVAQVVEGIQHILHRAPELADPRARLQAANDVKRSEQPAGRHSQVVHSHLGWFAATGPEPGAIILPALDECGVQVTPRRHCLTCPL